MAARPGIALALVGACAVLAVVRTQPPAPKGVDAPATEFSAARGMETLRRVLGDGAPHPVGTAAHEQVRERILEELRKIGLEPTVEESAAASHTAIAVVRNVVARIPGAEETKAVLLCAHYDSVPAGAGAGDDGSGVATLLEVARALKAGPPLRRPVILLIDDAEECGLVGAEGYVARHKVREEIEVVVNCDARGTEGPTFLFETSTGNADLVSLYARSVDRPCATSAAYEVYKRMPNDTDLTVFKRAGVAGLNFAFIGGLRRYHTPKDDLAHLSAASLQHEGDQVLAVARALAREEFQAKADGDLVYADVLGLFLLRWPASWSLPASIAIFVAIVGITLSNLRKRAVSWVGVARGGLFALATIAAAGVSAPAIVHGIELVRREPEPWAGHPLPFRIAIVAGAIVAALLVAILVERIGWFARAGFEGSWSGVWLALSLVGVASSAMVPGASYLYLVPCAIAVVARLSRNEVAAAAIPACALVLLGIPLTIGLEQAVELRAPVAIGLPIGWMLATIVPYLAQSKRVALAAAAVALAGSMVWSLAAPSSTEDDPAWVTLAHVEGPDTDSARVYALTFGSLLPAEMRTRAAFSMDPERAFPEFKWLPSGFAARSQSAPTDAANIEVLSTETQKDYRVVSVRISSPRGAPCLVVHASGLLVDAQNHQCNGFWVKIGESMFARSERLDDGDGAATCDSDRILFGLPPEGAVLQLRLPLDQPGQLVLLDVAYALPPCDGVIARARPARCVPRGQGDQWVVARRVEL